MPKTKFHSPNTNHPNEENEQENENDSTSNSSCNIGKVWLFLTTLTHETPDTLTEGIVFLVFVTSSFVEAEPFAQVCKTKRIIPQLRIK